MKIEWLGHAAFIITSRDGTRILTDPYESGGFYGSVAYTPIREKVDAVTISHAHGDHRHVPAGLGQETLVIRDKINASVKGINIKSVDSFHDSAGGRERGSNSIFIFDVDGIRVVHFGDLGHMLDDKQLKELGNVDVALLPVGGNFTIDANAANEVIKKLKPKIVIPMHFKTDKVGLDIDSVDIFLENKKDVERLKVSEIEITPALLSLATAKIILLKHSH